jgi:hypothetical protein
VALFSTGTPALAGRKYLTTPPCESAAHCLGHRRRHEGFHRRRFGYHHDAWIAEQSSSQRMARQRQRPQTVWSRAPIGAYQPDTNMLIIRNRGVDTHPHRSVPGTSLPLPPRLLPVRPCTAAVAGRDRDRGAEPLPRYASALRTAPPDVVRALDTFHVRLASALVAPHGGGNHFGPVVRHRLVLVASVRDLRGMSLPITCWKTT